MRHFLILITCLLSTCSLAKNHPLIWCPTPENLVFTQVSALSGQGKFLARGNVDISNSKARPFFLSGRTNALKAITFIGASYIPIDNDLICLYQGEQNSGKNEIIVLGEDKPHSVLTECQFQRGDHYECSGASPDQCELECE